MRAVTVDPKQKHSLALSEVAAPDPRPGELLVKALAIGICGTDREIAGGVHGVAPEGQTRLTLGHESLGAVMRAPSGSSFRGGDLVVGIVRRPDPLPCPSCAAGEWDMCQNGRFSERGIQRLNGYASEFFTLEERFAIAVPASLRDTGVLLEPASVVAKAWEQIDAISARLEAYKPKRTLVTGAGPVGLLAALLGVQRGHELHVLDRVTSGAKPELVRELGAAYYSDLSQLQIAPELILECTGAGELIWEAWDKIARNGIVCLAGISTGARVFQPSTRELNNRLVLRNEVIFGSVNANRRHYTAALDALERAPQAWLRRVINRHVPLERFADAYARQPGDVKVVLDFPA